MLIVNDKNAVLRTERNLNELENEKNNMENFEVCLLREVTDINSNLTVEAVRKAVEHSGLSWDIFEDQRKKDIVEKLQSIANLNESQCNTLFDNLNEIRPNELKRKKRDSILSMKRDFYEKWILKCMYSLSECFPMTTYFLLSVCVIFKVSTDQVGGEEILAKVKCDIEKFFQNALKLNMICYCQQPLSEVSNESVSIGYHCRLCQKSIRYKSYDCKNGSCIYKRISGLQFWICPSCYVDGAYITTLNYTDEEWKQIFVAKLKSSISVMSYGSSDLVI